jgi:hypothetical protein
VQSLKHHRRQSSTSSTQGIEFYNHVSETKRKVSQSLDLQVDTKHESRAISSCGLVCRSPIRRMDSGPKGLADKELIKEDYERAFIVRNVDLKPGENQFEMTGQVSLVTSFMNEHHLSHFLTAGRKGALPPRSAVSFLLGSRVAEVVHSRLHHLQSCVR